MFKFISAIFLITSLNCFSQKAKVIDIEQLKEIIAKEEGNIQVINFWATWCGPCIKELPLFEQARAAMPDKIDVLLVTVDFVEDINKVNKFIEKKGLQSQVLLIDNVDYNAWIDEVDKRWSGAIPATLIINPKTKERQFVESELKEGELESLIEALL